METTTRKTSRKTSRKPGAKNAESIQSAYIDYLLLQGHRPPSVFKFCTELGMNEDTFYDHFGSFEGLERSIWKSFITRTTDRLKADKAYASFSSREKILAFYYTFFEEIKSRRSFVLVQMENHRKLEIVPGFLKDFKSDYESYIESVLNVGQTNGEVASRPFFDKRYPQLFWFHMAFLLIFWKDDTSGAFEKTDAAIEKSVNLAFDLIGKGAVDSVIDFAKFLYQTKVK
jgi:AcrR family transcriptional regulator